MNIAHPDPATAGVDPTGPADRPRHAGLEARIAGPVTPTLADMGYELVRIAVLGRERPTVQIMADRADGRGFTVDDCEAISHAAGAVLDVEDLLAGQWTLEVSSPGIDRPLTRMKDWINFAGHLARVELEQPVAGRRRITGTILGADAAAAHLRLDDGSDFSAPLDLIRRAKLLLTDALIDATAVEAPAATPPPPSRRPPDKPARPNRKVANAKARAN